MYTTHVDERAKEAVYKDSAESPDEMKTLHLLYPRPSILQ